MIYSVLSMRRVHSTQNIIESQRYTQYIAHGYTYIVPITQIYIVQSAEYIAHTNIKIDAYVNVCVWSCARVCVCARAPICIHARSFDDEAGNEGDRSLHCDESQHKSIYCKSFYLSFDPSISPSTALALSPSLIIQMSMCLCSGWFPLLFSQLGLSTLPSINVDVHLHPSPSCLHKNPSLHLAFHPLSVCVCAGLRPNRLTIAGALARSFDDMNASAKRCSHSFQLLLTGSGAHFEGSPFATTQAIGGKILFHGRDSHRQKTVQEGWF